MTRGRPKYDDILTPREWDVLALLREGLTNQQIADRLGVSLNTAKYHVAEIRAKLGVGSREAAAAWRPEERSRLAGLALVGAALKYIPASVGGKLLSGAAAAAVIGALVVGLSVLVLQDDAGRLGKLAYVQEGDLWVMALPDGTPRRLTTDGNVRFPRWSTSGEWLLFSIATAGSDSEEWVMRRDGSERRRLNSVGYIPASWSPVGDELVYLRANGDTVVEEADGSNAQTALTPYSSPTELGLIYGGWTPDGTHLWYLEERWLDTESPRGNNESPQQPADAQVTHIAVGRVNVDGSNKRDTFTLEPSTEEQFLPLGWSGDGGTILFTTIPRGGAEFALDGLSVRAASAAGGPVRDLGVTVTFGSVGTIPGSNRVTLVLGNKRETWTNKQIAVVDLGSDQITQLTPADYASIAPIVSHDGQRIAYVSAPDLGAQGRDAALASRRIWVMNADGTDRDAVTAGEGFRDEAPQWSADDSHILFMRMTLDRCAPTYGIELLDAQTGAVEEVVGGLHAVSRNEQLVVGGVPECTSTSEAPVLDVSGRVQFQMALAWWQDERRP